MQAAAVVVDVMGVGRRHSMQAAAVVERLHSISAAVAVEGRH